MEEKEILGTDEKTQRKGDQVIDPKLKIGFSRLP